MTNIDKLRTYLGVGHDTLVAETIGLALKRLKEQDEHICSLNETVESLQDEAEYRDDW